MKLVRTLAIAGMLMMGLPALADNQAAINDAPPQIIAQAHGGSAAFARVSISDDQRQKLSALKDKYELDTAQQKALLRVTQHQLREVLSAPAVDKSAAAGLQTKINGLRDDLSNAKLNFMLAAGDVFTPEQRAAFKSMHHGHHHHGFGGHGQCGPGCAPGGHGHGGMDGKKVG